MSDECGECGMCDVCDLNPETMKWFGKCVRKLESKRYLGYVRRGDGGWWGEIYELDNGKIGVKMLGMVGGWKSDEVKVERKIFEKKEDLRKEIGLGGWLYDFEIVWNEAPEM